MEISEKPGVWWIKRDFRVANNAALCSAIQQHRHIIPLLVIEPALLAAPDGSSIHLHAQLTAAKALQQTLETRGARLFIATGSIISIFEKLLESTGFTHLYSHQETGIDLSYARDKKVANWCSRNDISWKEETQNGVVRGSHNHQDRPAIIAKRLHQQPPLPVPTSIAGYQGPLPKQISIFTPTNDQQWLGQDSAQALSVAGVNYPPQLNAANLQPIGEALAHRELDSFLNTRASSYIAGISSPNTAFNAGSRLSTHLAWGTLSLKDIFARSNEAIYEYSGSASPDAIKTVKSLRAFQSRLYWRDHFIQRFESASHMQFEALNPAYNALEYMHEEQTLEAWIRGTTGLPLVDACMRCLQATGFLNFRMRAMLVSVACFGLGLSWKEIQYPLARVFYDYEPGIHFPQIQMQAGIVGINTTRVYCPHKQLLNQDPECIFVKRWIPELAQFKATEICSYQNRPLGTYPRPLIDISARATVMKTRVYSIRNSEEARQASEGILKKLGSRQSRVKRKTPRAGGTQETSTQLNLELW